MYLNLPKPWPWLALVAGLLAPAAVAAAGDKQGYNLANPVPADRLREMTTDRPDSTESPFTVDPGHVQLEMDFANHTRDREDGGRTTEWGAVPFNLRLGLTADFEAGIFIVPYQRVTVTAPDGSRERYAGFGDVTLRAKWNGAGNDTEGFAWGLMADFKVPVAADGLGNDKFEGALTLPLAFALAGGWSGGAMTAIEWVHTDAGRRRAVWINTFTASRDLSETVGGFLELTSAAGDGRHVATFNLGLTRRFGPNLQLDCGANFGVSGAAPDQSYFVGISRRF